MESDKKITTEVAQKNPEPISFFEKDADFVFAFKKTEKLVSALYIVTNLFSDNEPIKWSLRKKSNDFLSFMIGYKDVSKLSQNDFIHNSKTKVLELVSLLEVAFYAGLISNMNFSIVKQEFVNLTEILDSAKKQSLNSVISPQFFNETNESGFSSNLQSKNSEVFFLDKASNNPKITQNIPTSTTLSSGKNLVKRSSRQSIIMGLFNKHKELTIKDVSMVIKNCSEKTIQRELISLMSEGVVKRTGERRWSKYSLV